MLWIASNESDMTKNLPEKKVYDMKSRDKRIVDSFVCKTTVKWGKHKERDIKRAGLQKAEPTLFSFLESSVKK